jgi:hypothetical protein
VLIQYACNLTLFLRTQQRTVTRWQCLYHSINSFTGSLYVSNVGLKEITLLVQHANYISLLILIHFIYHRKSKMKSTKIIFCKQLPSNKVI